MSVTVRHITTEEVPAFRAQIARGFGEPEHGDDLERFTRVFEVPRMIAAFDGGDVVGSCAAFTFDVTVPGGALPMAGTTLITVLSTHRRRGVLTAMMREHFEEILERGEPLAGLWASEAPIYGRFGYGIAAELHETALDTKHVRFAGDAPPGTCRWVEPDEARATFPAIHERVRPTRPGMLTRHDDWWAWRVFHDPDHRRGGGTVKRYVVFEGPNGADGYVIYRQHESLTAFPAGDLKVLELMPATPDAHAALWHHVLNVDLFPNVSYLHLPSDDALPFRVTDSRRVKRTPMDSLWVRIMDVPRALTERAYDAAGRLVLGVRDDFLPGVAGAYALDAAPEGASCARTDASPDLELSASALGAIYLGHHRPSVLARAGLVEGDTPALALADRLFAWPVAAWCPEIF